jgi:FdhD protein
MPPALRSAPVRGDTSRAVELVRWAAGTRQAGRDAAAVEEPLQLIVNGRAFAVIMRTPGPDGALAAGFLVGERIVQSFDDIVSLKPATAPDGGARHNVVDIVLGRAATARLAAVKRSVTTTAACGMCGRQSIDALAAAGLSVRSSCAFEAATLAELPARMRRAQTVFDTTGGLHAAGLFRADASLDQIAEDVGRHNAVDKVVGARWLARDWPLSKHVLCVSGRASYEIVLKALTAGIPIVAAVSAPSTLAIDLAETGGITLAGFVRENRLNVYTHPHRIT